MGAVMPLRSKPLRKNEQNKANDLPFGLGKRVNE
jgi:hypothetical protein